jgi:hypothetical protein
MKLTPNPETGLVHVEFDWDPQFGECYDCGAPAVYVIDGEGPRADHLLRCSVCAAQAAADGSEIVYLFERDERLARIEAVYPEAAAEAREAGR